MLTGSDESGRIGFHREEPDLLSVDSYYSGSSAGPYPSIAVFPDVKNIVVRNNRKFSGGIAREFFPVETVQSGWNTLAGSDPDSIAKAFIRIERRAKNDPPFVPSGAKAPSSPEARQPYGDGKAAEKSSKKPCD